MSIQLIVTHPGSSHKDEFLACSVLLALNPAPIERRDPTAADLADVSIAVVDVGLRHDPGLSNFDHHQFPKDSEPTCSLSLVLQHLGIYADARSFCEWLQPAEWFDCRGAETTARWLGVDRDVINKLNSPIDISLLRHFSKATRIEAGNALWEMMRLVGQDLVEYVTSLRDRLTYIDQHAQLWPLAASSGSEEKVLFMPRTDPLPEEPSMGLERYVESRGLSGQVVALIYPDRRSAGYGMSRFRDHPRMDFTRIASHPEVHFAHARGFVAKTATTNLNQLRVLLALAVRPD